MHKIFIVTVCLVLMSGPIAVSADQLSDLQAQIQNLIAQISQLKMLIPNAAPHTNSYCGVFTRDLHVGQTDVQTNGEVSKLQSFLAQDSSIYPEASVTGYFGPATERAVQRWQKTHSIVTFGDSNSTGYGYVGPKTRLILSQMCGTSGNTAPSAENSSQLQIQTQRATIDASSLESSSLTPTISGTATGVTSIGIAIGNNGGKEYGRNSIPVINGRWSINVERSFTSGAHEVDIYGFNSMYLTSGILFIDASASIAPACILRADKGSYTVGDPIVLQWTTKNAKNLEWNQNLSKDQFLLPINALPLSGSITVTALAAGMPQISFKANGTYGDSIFCNAVFSISPKNSLNANLTPNIGSPDVITIVSFDLYKYGGVDLDENGNNVQINLPPVFTVADSNKLEWDIVAKSSLKRPLLVTFSGLPNFPTTPYTLDKSYPTGKDDGTANGGYGTTGTIPAGIYTLTAVVSDYNGFSATLSRVVQISP